GRVEAYPTAREVAEYALGRYLSLLLYRMILETLTSEMAARMSAMRQATENAQEMIEHLTLVYNQARQHSITRELLDIVGTAEALKTA
ncbi:MAG: ATP F0F1 synthase subunit gamma, partial [Planctomycetota bacterium]